MKHSDFCAWGSISRAIIWLSWALGIFAFFGLFLHYKLVKMIFNEKILKSKHFMDPEITVGSRQCLLCPVGKAVLRIAKVYYHPCQAITFLKVRPCFMYCTTLLLSHLESFGWIVSVKRINGQLISGLSNISLEDKSNNFTARTLSFLQRSNQINTHY